jgi:hypothetical protein
MAKERDEAEAAGSRADLGLRGGRSAKVAHVDLAALGVHHHGDREPFLVVEPPDSADDFAVPLAVAVAHVDPRDVHAADGERLELGGAAGGGAHGADELGAARAPEPVLPQLRLGGGVHDDGGRGRGHGGGRRPRHVDAVRGGRRFGEGGEVGGRGGQAAALGAEVARDREAVGGGGRGFRRRRTREVEGAGSGGHGCRCGGEASQRRRRCAGRRGSGFGSVLWRNRGGAGVQDAWIVRFSDLLILPCRGSWYAWTKSQQKHHQFTTSRRWPVAAPTVLPVSAVHRHHSSLIKIVQGGKKKKILKPFPALH